MDAQRAQDAARQAALMQPGMLEIMGGGAELQPDPAFGRTTPGGSPIPAKQQGASPVPGQTQQKGGQTGASAPGRTSPMLQLLSAGRVVATLLRDAAQVPGGARGSPNSPSSSFSPKLTATSLQTGSYSMAGSYSGTDRQQQHLWQALSGKRGSPGSQGTMAGRGTAPMGPPPLWSLAQPRHDPRPRSCPLGQLAPDNGTHPKVLTFRCG